MDLQILNAQLYEISEYAVKFLQQIIWFFIHVFVDDIIDDQLSVFVHQDHAKWPFAHSFKPNVISSHRQHAWCIN